MTSDFEANPEGDNMALRMFLERIATVQSCDQSPLPSDVEEFTAYKNNMTNFISKRNNRPLDWASVNIG